MPLAQRLREAIAEREVSQRQLARELAGPDADDRRVENERRQLAKYLAGQHAPTVERARLLAELLGKPADYFIEPETARTRLVDQMRAMAVMLDDLRAVVEERLATQEEQDSLDLDVAAWTDRLRSLEEMVEAQGRSTTLALEALTAGIQQLIERLEAGVAPAKRRRRAAQ